MAEVTLDLRMLPKSEAYVQLDAHVRAVLEGVSDPIAAMATISALIHHAFGYLWTGFYRVVEPNALLRVGPYQGALGCLDIAFGRGVCGTAAMEKRTMIVDDVYEFAGHITCDARSRSEIVVPILNKIGGLVAVLDIDAEFPSAFDEEDQRGLERIASWFAELDA
jgi:L-methionine (R)-S-oxide reductase